jgi:hypothetical protein
MRSPETIEKRNEDGGTPGHALAPKRGAIV